MTLAQFDTLEKKNTKPFSWFIAFYFFWVGGVSCIVSNSVTNSYDYFATKFPNDNVSFLFPIGPYVANLVLILIISYLSTFISYNLRMLVPLAIIIVLEIIIPFEAYYFADTTFGICLMMGILFSAGFFSNMCYASMCGFTSQVGSEFTTYFMIGVACFGLIMNLLKEAILLICQPANDGEIGNILIYFGITAIFIAIGLVLHILFMRSNYYKIYFEPIVTDSGSRQSIQDNETGFIESTTSNPPPKRNLKTLLSIFVDAKIFICVMFIACIQHTMFYPGVMLLKPVSFMAKHTKTVSMVTTFSVFYIIGKKIGQYRQYYDKKTVVIVTMARFLLIIAFIVQVLFPTAPIISTLWFGYLNIALSGVSLGFLIVALLIMIPEIFPPNKKEVSGFVGVIGMNIGTMIGGFAALAFINL